MGQIKIFSASAGSGKTYRLAYRYVSTTIQNPEDYRHILAVTFTNKATDEMKRRILKEIDKLARGVKSDFYNDLVQELPDLADKIQQRALIVRSSILHDYSNFAVMTIDRFFQRVVRSFMRELGVELNYTLELKTDDLLSTATDNLIEGIADHSRLEHTVDEFVEGRIEDSRSWDLRGDIARLGKQLFNDAYYEAEVFTDTEMLSELGNKLRKRSKEVRSAITEAASSALNIIANAGLTTEDFAGRSRSFVAHLSKWASCTGALPAMTKTVLSAIDNPESWPNKTSQRRNDVVALYSEVNPRLQAIKEGLRISTTLSIILKRFDEFILLADLRNSLDDLCREKNILPISKTSRLIADLTRDSDAPFIYEKVGCWFNHYMIDEFQDTSHSQWNNFKPLIAESISSQEGEPVMLVGDVKQSIYRWRGGDWRILANEVKDYFSKISPNSVKTEPLKRNYRSCRNIIEFNNALIKSVVDNMQAHINATITKAAEAGNISAEQRAELCTMIGDAYIDYRQTPNKEEYCGYATLRSFNNNEGEEPPIIDTIKELQLRGFRPEEIAILVRSNNDGYKVANMLLEYKRQNDDPRFCFDIVTGEALRLDSSSTVQFIIACLKLSQATDDTISAALFNNYLGRKYNQTLDVTDIEFLQSLAAKSPEQAFESIIMRFKLEEHTDALAYTQALHQQILSFAGNTIADIPLFLRHWEETGCAESLVMPGGTSAITIITIHKSKGLEYKAVIIPYTDWKYSEAGDTMWLQSEVVGDGCAFPVSLSQSSADTEFAYNYYNEVVLQAIDALNIFYVAVTRAESELHIMVPAKPRGIGKIVTEAVIGLSEELVQKQEVVYNCTENPLLVSYGEVSEAVHKDDERQATIDFTFYPTSPIASKMRLRTPSERYTEDNDITLSPRDMGIMMHRAFQTAHTKQDITTAIKQLSAQSIISDTESGQLTEAIEKAFENATIAEWFSDKWEQIYTENDIILPISEVETADNEEDKLTRRPDRVMISGNRAIVVDYKFGRKQTGSHRNQIIRYAELLQRMGYTEIECYLWYVNMGVCSKVV